MKFLKVSNFDWANLIFYVVLYFVLLLGNISALDWPFWALLVLFTVWGLHNYAGGMAFGFSRASKILQELLEKAKGGNL